MLDTLIRGGTLVDGTGGPSRRADVGIVDGRIASLVDGGGNGAARRTIDASGLVVAPGFVDIHTHYDAQLFWDPTASPSPLHGVTTVVGGNCGFSLAPAGPAHAPYLMRMMARVEGMPIAALEAGLPWDWEGFGDWLSRLDGKIAVNAGFLCGHSALRRVAMGNDAVGGEATPEQIKEMVRLLEESLAAGALGFSTSQAHTHNDGEGQPVPSRAASPAELVELATAVSRHPGTTVELILSGSINGYSDEEIELMTSISLAANRPINWNVLGVSAGNRAQYEHQLDASSRAAARGARVVALTLPHPMAVRLSFATGFIFDGLPGWRETMHLPVPERIKALSDPETRRRLDELAKSPEAGMLGNLARWERLRFDEVFSPENKAVQGRRVGEVAAERGADPFDVLCEVVVADELRTGLSPPLMGTSDEDWKARAEVWHDERAVIGASDAGAHLDMMCGAVYSTSLLGNGVRERGLITLEEAVHQLSDVPARLYGLRSRGRVVSGWAADLVVFDPATVGDGPLRTRDDLPGGASRLYAEATGIKTVLVNGVPIVEDGEFTSYAPGRVLRSGVDTETVTVPGGGAA